MHWNDLSLKDKSDLMRLYIKNGIYSLEEMKKGFNESSKKYDMGGPLNDENKWYGDVIGGPLAQDASKQNGAFVDIDFLKANGYEKGIGRDNKYYYTKDKPGRIDVGNYKRSEPYDVDRFGPIKIVNEIRKMPVPSFILNNFPVAHIPYNGFQVIAEDIPEIVKSVVYKEDLYNGITNLVGDGLGMIPFGKTFKSLNKMKDSPKDLFFPTIGVVSELPIRSLSMINDFDYNNGFGLNVFPNKFNLHRMHHNPETALRECFYTGITKKDGTEKENHLYYPSTKNEKGSDLVATYLGLDTLGSHIGTRIDNSSYGFLTNYINNRKLKKRPDRYLVKDPSNTIIATDEEITPIQVRNKYINYRSTPIQAGDEYLIDSGDTPTIYGKDKNGGLFKKQIDSWDFYKHGPTNQYMTPFGYEIGTPVILETNWRKVNPEDTNFKSVK